METAPGLQKGFKGFFKGLGGHKVKARKAHAHVDLAIAKHFPFHAFHFAIEALHLHHALTA